MDALHPKYINLRYPGYLEDCRRFGLDINVWTINDEQMMLDFLRQQHVLMVAGTGFNWHEPDHFRIVYLPRIAELEEAMNKFELFLKNYRQY